MNRFPSLQTVASALLLVFVLSQTVLAQSFNSQYRVNQLNLNASFENGVADWNIRSIAHTILTRDWTDNGQFEFEVYGRLQSKLLRLRGAGTWGQTVFISPDTKYNILNVHAFRVATSGQGSGGLAFARVQYFNATGAEIDNVSIPIAARDTRKNRGIGDGLVFHSWGIYVPANATTARLTIVGAADTDVYVDSFGLFSYFFNPSVAGPTARNLLLNHDLNSNHGTDANLNVAQGYGVEFWQSELDWSSSVRELGSISQPEFVYQFLPVEGGKTYSLTSLLYDPKAVPSGSYGVDFYDANWRKIGSPFYLASDRLERIHRLEVPVGTAYASLWVYGDQLEPGQVGAFCNGMVVQLQAASINTATSAMLSRVGLRGTKGPPIGRGYEVIYSDSNGIDIASIDDNDAYFTSKTVQGRVYPAVVYTTLSGDNNRVVRVDYLAQAGYYDDVGSLVIRARQVKDSLGNFAPSRTFVLN